MANRYLLALLIGVSLAWAVQVRHARPHDYAHPDLKNWFMSLQSKGGSLCCDGKDAAHVSADDWTTQDKPNSHYKVLIEGEWTDVPDSALVDEPNKDPDQQALVWYFPSWYGQTKHTIRCFMPGFLS